MNTYDNSTPPCVVVLYTAQPKAVYMMFKTYKVIMLVFIKLISQV